MCVSDFKHKHVIVSVTLTIVCVCFLRQAKYHEDFERARGRGFTPGLDDPSMERYQRANQMMGEAGYSKGIHPHVTEMDRRPGGIIVGQ